MKLKRRLFRTVVISAIIALAGLLSIQVYWFTKAYHLQEAQLDEKINLALRSVADALLKSNNLSTNRIAPVTQTAGNTFLVRTESSFGYGALDTLIRARFAAMDIDLPFTLSLYSTFNDSLLLGNFYEFGVASGPANCVDREQAQTEMNFTVTFPDKQATILGAMDLWIFSAITFMLILVLFGLLLVDLSRQKKLAEMKNDFINNMTHELQTPITNISMASEVLRKGDLLEGTKAKRYLEIIHQENERLRQHVDQVLQTTKLDHSEIVLEKRKVDLNKLVAEVTSNFQLRIQQRNGKLSAQLKAPEAMVLGDPVHLTNVFYNLLDNADKYSKEKPEILITTQKEEKGILVSIADKGIGISRDVQQFIFDKFYRVSSGNIHDVKGFGLGLTYVKQIVLAHEGRISVTSERNLGSRFDLYFPDSDGE